MSLAEAVARAPGDFTPLTGTYELDIHSSALAAATYTLGTGTLAVTFTDGKSATYQVSLATALALESAGSQGAYFNANIRG
jgi:hypothetical protein